MNVFLNTTNFTPNTLNLNIKKPRKKHNVSIKIYNLHDNLGQFLSKKTSKFGKNFTSKTINLGQTFFLNT